MKSLFPSKASSLPLVVQLGFAGARELVDGSANPEIDHDAFTAGLTDALVDFIGNLPSALGLSSSNTFFCGISQIAIGGDQIFAIACQRLGILHRLFLPQPLDAYLSAVGSKGPDFSPEQRAMAETLVAGKTIIQTRVVSDASDRHNRLRDVNLEIARVSDVVLCLVRGGQSAKAGGSHELAEMAARRGRPVIVMEVTVGSERQPVLKRRDEGLGFFVVPFLPGALAGAHIPSLAVGKVPSGGAYVDRLKSICSDQANRLRFWFRWAAIIIVGGHVLATILAVCVLKLHHNLVTAVFLGSELLLLAAGLWVHHAIHQGHSIGRWAAFRLIAEVARSIRAIGPFPVYLEHFFSLPLPAEFRPLLRTINVLHLRDTVNSDISCWKARKRIYVDERLRNPKNNAQIPYHDGTRNRAAAYLRLTRGVFYGASFGALGCTLIKLLHTCRWLPVPNAGEDLIIGVLGALAVVLPVVAVAALSLAAAFDVAAKEHTSSEMLEFLERQAVLLEGADSPREFSRLLIETESRLLGETVNWYARRFYVGVT